MAQPCPHDRLHVNMEGCMVEVIDDAGQPVRPGQMGRVIVTPFLQTAQPLIRYEQGDLAILGGRCSCGRHAPTLDRVLGRSISIFRHPDGRSIAKLMPDETATLLDSTYFQLAQVAPNGYELRYVPADWDRPGDEREVEHLFRQTFFDDAELRFVRSRAIAARHAGKIVEYINEWAARS
jgi:phenylacetate-CoA ligase